MEDWTNWFSGYDFSTDVSSRGLHAWAISHEDAAANIDVLAERLENVLRDLQQLEVAEG